MVMKSVFICFILIPVIFISAFQNNKDSAYKNHYNHSVLKFSEQQNALHTLISKSVLADNLSREAIKKEIANARRKLKSIDFWLRYFEPNIYKKINGPLPVEWESEVFEKFEKPYKREGAGLALAEIYLDNKGADKDSLLILINNSLKAIDIYKADSITKNLDSHHHFFLCNRLFLLNLAAIYTTGFECPDREKVIPELQNMLSETKTIYEVFNQSFPEFQLTEKYLSLYNKTISFISAQPADPEKFDHFTFIKDYVNPLFVLNQQYIIKYDIFSKSYIDFTLNNSANSIFDKSLFFAQNTKGIYSHVNDEAALKEIENIGKLLFYDPILSGNNLRSCASCHKPTQYFTDTSCQTAFQFNKKNILPRNTPSLLNAPFNHLLMLDGKHLTLQEQAKHVINNPIEMGGDKDLILKKVLACADYKTAFKKYLKYTPQEKDVTIEHVVSAITYYYGKFSHYYSPFDEAMNNNKNIDQEAVKGFNIFMGKAQCATCHFVPQFSGIKPPYVGNEFEVIGVPVDLKYSALSKDKGRFEINPAPETANAFRTTTIRNSTYTKPFMHNGVFLSLKEVIDFYNGGGGLGRKIPIHNQTLAVDSLRLTDPEQQQLIIFINSLNENIKFETPPLQLPVSKNKNLNNRKVGGEY